MIKLIEKNGYKIIIFEDENGTIIIRNSNIIEKNFKEFINAKTIGKKCIS